MGCGKASIVAQLLPDNKRLHLQHGPIDLIIDADGAQSEVQAAYTDAVDEFRYVLSALVDELGELRKPVADKHHRVFGPVARRMVDATSCYSQHFITPMAAVAGSVADHMLQLVNRNRSLSRVHVNNGGDIAFSLRANEHYTITVCTDPVLNQQGASLTISASDGIGGIATSGWRGRSHSLGIADAVTVLASSAADADAAATLIANAVDLPGSSLIKREPASSFSDDSDLGDRLVTVDVAPLPVTHKCKALKAGISLARQLNKNAQVHGVFLYLQGESAVVGDAGFNQRNLKFDTPLVQQSMCT